MSIVFHRTWTFIIQFYFDRELNSVLMKPLRGDSKPLVSRHKNWNIHPNITTNTFIYFNCWIFRSVYNSKRYLRTIYSLLSPEEGGGWLSTILCWPHQKVNSYFLHCFVCILTSINIHSLSRSHRYLDERKVSGRSVSEQRWTRAITVRKSSST